MIRPLGLAIGAALLASALAAAPAQAANLPAAVTGTPAAQQTSGCELAQQIIQKALVLSRDSKSDEAIVAAMKKVAAALPVDQAEAQNYVDVYGNMIIQLVQQNLTAQEVAAAIGVC